MARSVIVFPAPEGPRIPRGAAPVRNDTSSVNPGRRFSISTWRSIAIFAPLVLQALRRTLFRPWRLQCCEKERHAGGAYRG